MREGIWECVCLRACAYVSARVCVCVCMCVHCVAFPRVCLCDLRARA